MLRLRKPSSASIRNFLAAQSQRSFTYDDLGATASSPPQGYTVDHTRVWLGEGEEVFLAAKRGLQNWQQFRLGWLEATPTSTPIREGEVIAIVAHALGFWWLSACKLVYKIEDQSNARRFGFAYGTLPEHAGTGEERFLVEMTGDGSVWFDILAFSRPHHVLARVAYPYMRVLQKRFGRDACRAMQHVVKNVATPSDDAVRQLTGVTAS